MNYQPRDRCPWGEMGFWPETLERWHDEGWPEDIYMNEFFGFDRLREGVGIHTDFVPGFKAETLEETDDHRIVRRSTGVIAKEFKGDLSFHMPQWLRFPLETRDDWENEIKPRLNPHSPTRYPEYWNERVRMYENRDYPLTQRLGSIYGRLRNWMGLDRICMLFYDDPEWLQEMMDYMAGFYCGVGRRVLEDVDLDYILLWEDMAYKGGPHISPAMFRQFMMEPYQRLTGFIRDHGVDLIIVDSDGYCDALMPLWLEGGVNGFYPIERASNMDPVELRAKYGRELRLLGGIDKRAMAAGPQAIDAQLAHVAPLVKEGGYIPWCDHHVPPDVSLENYQYYVRRMKELSLDPDGFRPAS
jgi:uroporphyrinogen decarboxylase